MVNRLKSILADFFQQADLVLLGLCCVSTLYGLVLIFSATQFMETKVIRYVGVQGAAMVIGVCAYIFMSMLDLENLMKKWKWLVLFNIVFIGLLMTPLGEGHSTGNVAWLKFPVIPFRIGPAEVVKITFTLLLAKQLVWLREEKRDLKSFRSALLVAGHTLLLMGWYVIISGDMGNALTFFFIFLYMAFTAGFALRWFVLLFAGIGGTVSAVLFLDLVPKSMEYMVNRFRVLFDHSLDLGMVGCLLIILLLTALILRVLLVAKRSQIYFHSYVCVGMAAMLIYQTVINIGMCLFVMPTIGVTLPFFSYGGSSIVTLYTAMGVVSNIKKRTLSMDRRSRSLL